MATLADTLPCLTHTVSQPHQGGMVSPQAADVEVESQRLRNLATAMELVNSGPGFELKFTLISKAMIFSKLPHPTQLLGDLMSSYLTYFKGEHLSQTTNRVTGVQPYWLPHDPGKSANYPCTAHPQRNGHQWRLQGAQKENALPFERSVSCFCRSLLTGGECLPCYLAAGYVFLCNILEQPKAHASSQLPLGFWTCPEDPARGTHLGGKDHPLPCFPGRSVNPLASFVSATDDNSQAASLLPSGRANELLHVHSGSGTGSCPHSLWDVLYCFPFAPFVLKTLGLKPLVTVTVLSASWPGQADLSPAGTLGDIWCHHCYLLFIKGTPHTGTPPTGNVPSLSPFLPCHRESHPGGPNLLGDSVLADFFNLGALFPAGVQGLSGWCQASDTNHHNRGCGLKHRPPATSN